MNCLVTGGAGFIGSNLVKALLERDHSVRVLDNFTTGEWKNLEPFQDFIQLIEGDLRDCHAVHEAVRDIELIFHQGALPSVLRSVNNPITTNQVNIEGTLNMLDAAREAGVRRVVYASSASTYGENLETPKREDMASCPISPYGVAKLAGEKYCQVFTRIYGLETVCLRYFNVFGPGQDARSEYTGAIPIFITAFLDGDKIVVDGDGKQTKDFTFVDNVVQANLLAADAEGVAGEVFNIACGQQTSINQILSHLRKITGIDVDVTYGPPRPGDIKHSQADISKACRILGYRPMVSVVEGLRRSVAWYRVASNRNVAIEYQSIDESQCAPEVWLNAGG